MLQKNSLPEKQDKSSVGSLRFLELFTETFRDVLTAVLTHTSTNISTAFVRLLNYSVCSVESTET